MLRSFDSLQYYWLVDSQSQSVDCFQRTEQGWLLYANGVSDRLPLPGFYEDVILDSADQSLGTS